MYREARRNIRICRGKSFGRIVAVLGFAFWLLMLGMRAIEPPRETQTSACSKELYGTWSLQDAEGLKTQDLSMEAPDPALKGPLCLYDPWGVHVFWPVKGDPVWISDVCMWFTLFVYFGPLRLFPKFL